MKMTSLFGKVFLAVIVLSCQTGFAQTSTSTTAGLQNTLNVKAIKAWYTAWQKNDWNSLEQVLATGFTFSSPLDDHINVKTVKERCWPNAGKFKRVEFEKFVVNGDDAFVIGNAWTINGKFMRNIDYFKLKDGQIAAYECFFGPGVNFPNSGK
jgi:hypothetical protein